MGSSWKSLFAVVVGAFVVGLEAQIQAGGDLNSVLSSQKNLTTFYSLVKVCPEEMIGFEHRTKYIAQKYPKILNNLPSSATVRKNLNLNLLA